MGCKDCSGKLKAHRHKECGGCDEEPKVVKKSGGNRKDRRKKMKDLGILNKTEPFLLFKSVAEFINDFDLRDKDAIERIDALVKEIVECRDTGLINKDHTKTLFNNLNRLIGRVNALRKEVNND